ncbi:MAG TPA: hypothetical protein VGS12_09405, partial [Caulobacteraceae bacterium]|nr:hypothetical protein [Caulobacteraceae bacterium]
GGAGGSGGLGGLAGAAKAFTVAQSAGMLTASAIAHGGLGIVSSGHASAKTKATASGGYFSAHADASLLPGQLLRSAAVIAGGSLSGKETAKGKAIINDPTATAFTFITGQTVAQADGEPNSASTKAVLTANPTIATAFGASPSYFGLAELGGGYSASGGSGSETVNSSAFFTVDLTKLASRGSLLAGYFSPTITGAFTSVSFTLTADGHQLVSQTFTTAAELQAFFNDQAANLGSLASGPLSGDTLTLDVSLSVTTAAAGDSVFVGLILGDPPSSGGRFVQAMAALGRSPGAVAHGEPWRAAAPPLFARA